VAVIEVWRDITDRRELEAGLEQSERLAALGVLASSVAHEVGNPLAAILTAVDGLLARLAGESSASPAEIRDYLEIVRKQVFRCHTVTERLLGFARLPTGGDAVIDVASAAREVLTLVGPEARVQRVECEVRAPSPVLAMAPPMLVEQVFLNLVLNALKAMPSGGRLRVDVTGGGGAVAVSFSDTGPGIPKEIGKHLFQPFRRARQDRGGTGLGLFISQALMARAGGAIEVESHPGAGTTFVVRLRQAPEAGTPSLADRSAGVLT
jgi:two-component system, NtrC family, sensor kinase